MCEIYYCMKMAQKNKDVPIPFPVVLERNLRQKEKPVSENFL